MAKPVDIVLKVIGDVRDAAGDLQRVGRTADATKTKVDEVERSVERTAQRVTDRLRSLAARGAAFAGQLSVAWAAAAEAGRRAAEIAQDITGTSPEDIAAADKALAEAGSLPELEAAFATATNKRGGLGAIASGFVSAVGQKGALGGLRFALGKLSDRDESDEVFARLYAANPARARALAAANPRFRAQLAELEKAAAATAAFNAQLAQDTEQFLSVYEQRTTVNAAININDRAGGGRGATGRHVTAAQEIRNRNNGRPTQTSRRG